MFVLKKLLSALFLPPFGLLLAVVLGLALLSNRRYRYLGRIVIGCALAALMLLSLPLVGNTLLRSLETAPPITAAGLKRAQAIVVLGGGIHQSAPEYGRDTVSSATLERLRYAARLKRASDLPLLVTGGAPFGGRPEGIAMAQTLTEDFGVPVRWIEHASRDTRENAAMSATLLRRAGITRIALVSHSWHLPRATELFERQGLTVIPAPTVFTPKPSLNLQNLLPSVGALKHSYVAIHEWLGRTVQRLRY